MISRQNGIFCISVTFAYITDTRNDRCVALSGYHTGNPAKFFYDTRRLNGRMRKRKEILNRSSRKFSKSDETLFGERVEKKMCATPAR